MTETAWYETMAILDAIDEDMSIQAIHLTEQEPYTLIESWGALVVEPTS